MVSLYVVVSALSAIKHNSDGSWPMPVLLFYLAVFLFVVGSAEIIFVLFKHYRTFDARCQAISRALSCYGVVFTIIVMCDLYLFTVRY
jgi:peptidoglycan biosynthesis protein MviN/MurJ (putative lipid II flippase)